jgi:hypothetical protein
MVRRALLLLCIGFLTLFAASCGQTYELQSITVTPGTQGANGAAYINLEGIGAFQQLTVTAHYSNTKTQDVTTKSQFELNASADPNAPLTALSLNRSGLLEVVNAACTWYAEPTDSPTDSQFGYSTDPYPVTVTYSGFTTTTFVSVANEGDCYDGQKWPAPKGFPGN